jgi:hypothetical protein
MEVSIHASILVPVEGDRYLVIVSAFPAGPALHNRLDLQATDWATSLEEAHAKRGELIQRLQQRAEQLGHVVRNSAKFS